MKATSSQVREFLKVFKKAGEKERIRFVGREKNWDYLADTGITTSMREEALFSLSVHPPEHPLRYPLKNERK